MHFFVNSQTFSFDIILSKSPSSRRCPRRVTKIEITADGKNRIFLLTYISKIQIFRKRKIQLFISDFIFHPNFHHHFPSFLCIATTDTRTASLLNGTSQKNCYTILNESCFR